MGFAILRTQKLKCMQSIMRSLKHAFREQSTPNADPSRTPGNTHLGSTSAAEAKIKFKERLATQAKIRANAVLGIEYLVTGSPEVMNGKARSEQDSYFSDALDWLRKKHGAENVVYAGIHRDETTPHMYAYVVPIDERGKLNCRSFLGGAKALNLMQTDFAESVGLKHDLERGIEGSKANHQSISRYYAQIAKEQETIAITPEQIKPRVLKKRILGRNDMESDEAVANRLTAEVEKQYEPVIKQALTASSDRIRLRETQLTNQSLVMQKKVAEDRLQKLTKVFAPLVELGKLDSSQTTELVFEAHQRTLKIKEAREKEKRASLDPNWRRNTSGAAYTLSEHIESAIRANDGDTSGINWKRIEYNAAKESMLEHRQESDSVLEAILKYSPGAVSRQDKEQSKALVLDLAKQQIKIQEKDLSNNRDDGLSR